MDAEILRTDYEKFRADYHLLQNEAYKFVSTLRTAHESAIHIAHVHPRPDNEIKSLESILRNLSNPDKYKGYKTLTEVKDIAGVRVICNCEDDVENFSLLLEGELRQKYDDVKREDKGGTQNTGKSRPPYRAVHITFSKKLQTGESLFCEVQVRTVMADAWATLDRKYVYGKSIEGDAYDLTNAVSEIMNGCEKLWTMVKKKSVSGIDTAYRAIIEDLRKETARRLASMKVVEGRHLYSWFEKNSARATIGLRNQGYDAYMELRVTPPDIGLALKKSTLRDSARNSTIRTFGWPIGVFLDKEEYAPKVDPEGIHAEIPIPGPDSWHKSYDYWAINTNGAAYVLTSLFEDDRDKRTEIFFNTRIVRITEILMYINNLYKAFGVPPEAAISITLKHSGLKSRTLTSSSLTRHLSFGYKSDTEFVLTTVQTSLKEIDASMVDVVQKFTEPLFEIFNFFELSKDVLTEIVMNFTKGKVV